MLVVVEIQERVDELPEILWRFSVKSGYSKKGKLS